MEQLFANNNPGKRWQYTGRAKEGLGKWDKRECSCQGKGASLSMDIGWRKSRACGSQLNPRQLPCRSKVFNHTELHVSIESFLAFTLRLLIKTQFKFSCSENLLPDNMFIFIPFLITNTLYSLQHKGLHLFQFTLYNLLNKIIMSQWEEHVMNFLLYSSQCLGVQVHKV